MSRSPQQQAGKGPRHAATAAARPLPQALKQMEEMATAELAEAARLAAAATPGGHDDPLETCLAWDMAAPMRRADGTPEGQSQG